MILTEADADKALQEMGIPRDYIDRLRDLNRFTREEALPTFGSAVKDVTGREPASFDQFAREYVAHWKP